MLAAPDVRHVAGRERKSLQRVVELGHVSLLAGFLACSINRFKTYIALARLCKILETGVWDQRVAPFRLACKRSCLPPHATGFVPIATRRGHRASRLSLPVVRATILCSVFARPSPLPPRAPSTTLQQPPPGSPTWPNLCPPHPPACARCIPLSPLQSRLSRLHPRPLPPTSRGPSRPTATSHPTP